MLKTEYHNNSKKKKFFLNLVSILQIIIAKTKDNFIEGKIRYVTSRFELTAKTYSKN